MSADEETDKFKEALVAVMTQRIQDYLKVKNGSYEDKEITRIVQSKEFKIICNEQLADFKIDYRKFIQLETPLFIEQYAKDKLKEMMKKPSVFDFQDFNTNSFNMDSLNNTVVKSVEQEAFDQVDKLNQHIFEKHMTTIKQMMTIAILETQALLDTIYDQEKKFV